MIVCVRVCVCVCVCVPGSVGHETVDFIASVRGVQHRHHLHITRRRGRREKKKSLRESIQQKKRREKEKEGEGEGVGEGDFAHLRRHHEILRLHGKTRNKDDVSNKCHLIFFVHDDVAKHLVRFFVLSLTVIQLHFAQVGIIHLISSFQNPLQD